MRVPLVRDRARIRFAGRPRSFAFDAEAAPIAGARPEPDAGSMLGSLRPGFSGYVANPAGLVREAALSRERTIPERREAVPATELDRAGEDALPAELRPAVAKAARLLHRGTPGGLEVQIDPSQLAE